MLKQGLGTYVPATKITRPAAFVQILVGGQALTHENNYFCE